MSQTGTLEPKKYRSMKLSKRVSQIILWIVLLLGASLMVVPFIWMIATSFDFAARLTIPFPPRFIPKEPSLKPYQMLFKNINMIRLMLNTLIVAVGCIAISLTSALMAGYGLGKIRFKGARVVLLIALSTMMIPFEVTMIPTYMLFSKLGLVSSYWAFYLPSVTYVFGTFFVKQFMDSLPDALREAAKIDGAPEFTVFARIFLPLCGPVIATLTVLMFLGHWNNFLWPLLILNDQKKFTIQVGVALFTYNQGLSQMPAMRMASTTIAILPVLTVYLFLQRYIVESVALSGIKQ